MATISSCGNVSGSFLGTSEPLLLSLYYILYISKKEDFPITKREEESRRVGRHDPYEVGKRRRTEARTQDSSLQRGKHSLRLVVVRIVL